MRETFATRLGLLATMIGVAVGLGNVWRFPYMVGRFGGAAFVLLYLLFALIIGVPALMAEWSLGRETRRGSVGAFQRAGLPGGRALGWILFRGCHRSHGILLQRHRLGPLPRCGGGGAVLRRRHPSTGGGVFCPCLPPSDGHDGRG